MNIHNEDGNKLNGIYLQKKEISDKLMKKSFEGSNMVSWLKEKPLLKAMKKIGTTQIS
jgi:hypothetical protein